MENFVITGTRHDSPVTSATPFAILPQRLAQTNFRTNPKASGDAPKIDDEFDPCSPQPVLGIPVASHGPRPSRAAVWGTGKHVETQVLVRSRRVRRSIRHARRRARGRDRG